MRFILTALLALACATPLHSSARTIDPCVCELKVNTTDHRLQCITNFAIDLTLIQNGECDEPEVHGNDTPSPCLWRQVKITIEATGPCSIVLERSTSRSPGRSVTLGTWKLPPGGSLSTVRTDPGPLSVPCGTSYVYSVYENGALAGDAVVRCTDG